MSDYDMILHDMVTTRGAESVVRDLLGCDEYRMEQIIATGEDFSFPVIADKQIRFEASRAAYKIAQRNKRLEPVLAQVRLFNTV